MANEIVLKTLTGWDCMNILRLLLVFIAVGMASIFDAKPSLTSTKVNDTTCALTVTFDLEPHEYLYKDYIDFSIDNPHVHLTAWKSAQNPTTHYDPTFKEDKKIFKNQVTITLNAINSNSWANADEANIHVSYYLNSHNAITEDILPITLPEAAPQAMAYALDAQEASVEMAQPIDEQITAPAPQPKKLSLSARIYALTESTQSIWLRILLAMFLGLLLSLTPCIYPMIPITVGILQSRGSKSLVSNFLISCTYVLGIATTFAILGLLAAFTGQMVGSCMNNPLVILAIVALLVYVALSMLGLYELYIPRSLQSNKSSIQGGSLLSIFIFGALSGTIASPCLSPGLVLLLSIVTTLGSKIMGFALLFAFGMGLGVPLIIIGTFSSSLALLPKAGMWMVEIKKLSGLLLLGMCFYFLKTIIPLNLLLWMLSFFLAGSGIWLLYDTKKTVSKSWRFLKNLIGIAAIAAACLTMAYATKAQYTMENCDESDLWQNDYTQAHAKAIQENKRLFIDIGAPFCSICKAIDSTILKDQAVVCALQKYSAVKIDGSDKQNPVVQKLQEKYSVLGFPTFLLLDATTNTLLKRWGGELYEMAPADFAAELDHYTVR